MDFEREVSLQGFMEDAVRPAPQHVAGAEFGEIGSARPYQQNDVAVGDPLLAGTYSGDHGDSCAAEMPMFSP
jgi:hypothetical protein